MERQEIFDTVVKKVVKQGKPAVIDGICQYYVAPCEDYEKESRCAIGHLLTKKLAMKLAEKQKECDGLTVDLVLKLGNIKLPDWFNKGNLKFLQALQDAHDNMSTRKNVVDIFWFEDMRKITKNYRLKTDVLNEYEKKATN